MILRAGDGDPADYAYIYLHGFCSSPGSKKAQYLRACLEKRGLELHIPDLNAPDFTSMTMSSQLGALETFVDESGLGALRIIGSSMGALVALLFAEARGAVDALVLLAPAFALFTDLDAIFGEGTVERWHRRGQLEVYHFDSERLEPIDVALYDDGANIDFFALQPSCPMLILHGADDAVAAPSAVREYVARRRAIGHPVSLEFLPSEHQLLDGLETLWEQIAHFFGLGVERP